MSSPIIRPAVAADQTAWRRLWQGYLDFYEASDLPEENTAATWARILDPANPINCTVAVVDDAVVGFAVTVLHPCTWALGPVCYLEDLFIDPAIRGKGLGRALITELADRGRAEGWARVFWQTHKDNLTAQRLYDALCPQTDWRRYDIALT